MSRRTMIVLSYDLCDQPDEDTEVTTVTFGFARRSYQLDLCAAHASHIQDTIAGWATKGRPARNGRPGRRQPAAAARRRNGDTKQIRRWARQHGCPVPDRGPLPAAVIAAHHAAQPDNSATSAGGLATGAGVEV